VQQLADRAARARMPFPGTERVETKEAR
jgi:hypothetical protein